MKTDIHPKYKDVTFSCSCGATFVAGSTLDKDFKTEICSQCHPFYTGKQKLIDKSGRVDRFNAKRKKAQALAEKNVKTVDPDEDDEEVAKETAEEAEEKPKTKEKKAEAETEAEVPDATEEVQEELEEKTDEKAE